MLAGYPSLALAGRPTFLNVRAPRFSVALPVRIANSTIGLSGKAVTIDVSRTGILVCTARDGSCVGDTMCFVVELPGIGGRRGADADCCGHITRVEPLARCGLQAVAISIERYRLRRPAFTGGRRRSESAGLGL